VSDNRGVPVESLEAWLNRKPFWEKYVWKLNFEKQSLTSEDIDDCYTLMCEHLGLIPPSLEPRAPISFDDVGAPPGANAGTVQVKLRRITNLKNVNALAPCCSLSFGDNLTIVYGANGTGKSGVSRLLCNACFSRGEREILPDVKTSAGQAPISATFTIDDGFGELTEVNYGLGDRQATLKRFSVFDSKSVLIHLDQSNNVNFTPAEVIIFDKVGQTISKLEEKMLNDKNARKKSNPFDSMFLDYATSSTATFCKSINGATEIQDFLKHASFDEETDGKAIIELSSQIEEKKKLDIPKRKAQLVSDRQNLAALKAVLETAKSHFDAQSSKDINDLLTELAEKRRIVETLGSKSFEDSIFRTVGTLEWKSLIAAAMTLYDAEKRANGGKELTHCLLCHQELSSEAKSLFLRYWEFLKSKAETELLQATQRHATLLRKLETLKAKYPQFLATDSGVKLLSDEAPTYLTNLKNDFSKLAEALDDWISRIQQSQPVGPEKVPTIDFGPIEALRELKANEAAHLVDPSAEIQTLTAQLNALKHRKAASTVKDAALEYIAYLKWLSKAEKVGFPSIKMGITKKRTDFFQAGVAKNYKGVFNQELAALGCEFNLVMNTSGEHGNTVKEYRLDFARDYNPSQILSEGEQNACSIADFLTEAQLDEKNCGVIFDDPVSSLDHERKDRIAERLAKEARSRQVIVFTHDKTFISRLVYHAEKKGIPLQAHWMRTIAGVPGYVEENSSPKMTSLTLLKKDYTEAVRDYDSMSGKDQEQALGVALDYLRSACEALVEQLLFGKTLERNEDQIRVQNLEEAVFDQGLALRIVDVHGRISEVILAHNRSDQKRENAPTLSDFAELRKEFEELETALREAQKAAKKNREARKKAKEQARAGW
jgi:hypothetical protein